MKNSLFGSRARINRWKEEKQVKKRKEKKPSTVMLNFALVVLLHVVVVITNYEPTRSTVRPTSTAVLP